MTGKPLTSVDGWLSIQVQTHTDVSLTHIFKEIDDHQKTGQLTETQLDFFIKRLLLINGEKACVDKWIPFITAIQSGVRKKGEDMIINELKKDLVKHE